VKRLIALAPLTVLIALGVLFATFGLHHDPHYVPDALVGHEAPNADLPNLDGGGTQQLARVRGGQPVLVNFFASWCIPCAQDAPALLAMKAQGVRVIGVAYKDDPAATRAFLARYGDPFSTVLVDRDGRAGVDFGVDGAPDTFVISADGKVLAKHAGPLLPEDAESILETLQRRRS
jgi:cytochrome c biogenesis protein CcmG, thiol:disulfide interchange protein DsbE